MTAFDGWFTFAGLIVLAALIVQFVRLTARINDAELAEYRFPYLEDDE